jgi:hypothetical protein
LTEEKNYAQGSMFKNSMASKRSSLDGRKSLWKEPPANSVCYHQDLLFPRPEELNCFFKSLIGTLLHPQDVLYDPGCLIGKSDLA